MVEKNEDTFDKEKFREYVKNSQSNRVVLNNIYVGYNSHLADVTFFGDGSLSSNEEPFSIVSIYSDNVGFEESGDTWMVKVQNIEDLPEECFRDERSTVEKIADDLSKAGYDFEEVYNAQNEENDSDFQYEEFDIGHIVGLKYNGNHRYDYNCVASNVIKTIEEKYDVRILNSDSNEHSDIRGAEVWVLDWDSVEPVSLEKLS